jgi:hypothetical protein
LRRAGGRQAGREQGGWRRPRRVSRALLAFGGLGGFGGEWGGSAEDNGRLLRVRLCRWLLGRCRGDAEAQMRCCWLRGRQRRSIQLAMTALVGREEVGGTKKKEKENGGVRRRVWSVYGKSINGEHVESSNLFLLLSAAVMRLTNRYSLIHPTAKRYFHRSSLLILQLHA